MHHPSEGTLFLHYPCFDGLVSAAIAWDFLESRRAWTIQNIRFVNYGQAKTWLETQLPKHSAVVDFLYHPDTEFWADHHSTSFLNAESRSHYESNAYGNIMLYDRLSPSCAMLLWKALGRFSSDPLRYEEMASWADRIDGAQYVSVDEALFGSAPAMIISASLAFNADHVYGEQLLRAMRTMSLKNIAELPDVRSRADVVYARVHAGLRLVEGSIKLIRDLAIFEVQQTNNAIINRYSAYHFYPQARYSIGLIRSATGAKITAMRNPWLDFESVELGDIFKKYGGGGHKRVASLMLNADKAHEVLAQIMQDIDAQNSAYEVARA